MGLEAAEARISAEEQGNMVKACVVSKVVRHIAASLQGRSELASFRN